MIYSDFQDKKLSLLGFGTMRLPLIPGGKGSDINQTAVDEMVDFALKNGVNYFDTAYPYHESMSEVAVGRSLKRYPRESFFLADKYPGHQIAETYNPAEIFEDQLKKCQVDYFDFYLLHNVNEHSVGVYCDEKWGIVDYFVEQKRLGRIKHLGFSCHAGPKCMREFLERYGDVLEFCQIQLNYLDWTLQEGEEKCRILNEFNMPIWVMEPVRGGKLANLPDELSRKLKAVNPDQSIASWGFRFLQDIEGIAVILSGMSNLEQMKDNIKTFSERKPLNAEEKSLVFEVAEVLKNAVPCTGCRYCCDGCPAGLDIPLLIALYNDARIYSGINVSMRVDGLCKGKMPSDCIGCGQCYSICPQKINVPELMPVIAEEFSKLPSWAKICRERAEAAKKRKI